MRNKTVGFYLSMVASVLALIAIVVYTQVMYRTIPVYIALIAVVVLEVVAGMSDKYKWLEWIPGVGAVLLAFAFAFSFFVMVNQLGYVYAGLDTISSVMSFIIFAGIVAVAMIINWVAGFLRQHKEEV